MHLFRRKDKHPSPQPGAPEIPGLNLPGNQSFVSLAGAHRYGVTDRQAGAAAGTDMDGKGANGSTLPSAMPTDRKFGTMQNLSSAQSGQPDKSTPATVGHQPQSSSMSRSMSQGAVPYHLPWTRNLTMEQGKATDAAKDGEAIEQADTAKDKPKGREVSSATAPLTSPQSTTTASRRKMGPPPSAFHNAAGSLPGLFNQPLDFRTSPASLAQPSPSQRRQVIDTARRMSLKRSKAPIELNLMLVGATGTGKTSFVRSLLATCDLSLCSDESKVAAAMFGIAQDLRHPTHDTNPITPLRTSKYDILSGIDLHPNSLIPIAALESGAHLNGRNGYGGARPQSVFSTRMSTMSGLGGGRVQLSVCDTPGMDLELEDEFEIERKVSAMLRHLEDRLGKTLSEESKVQRQARGDGHIHLVLYFIDPRFMVEQVAARRQRRDQARYASAAAAARLDEKAKEEKQRQHRERPHTAQADVRRSRSTSLSAQAAPAALQASNGSLNKQARTAQLRESMEAVRAQSARRESVQKRPTSKDSTISASAGAPTAAAFSPTRGATGQHVDDQEVDVEGLSQQQISILARLSERANVLPVIAKADTLTQAQLDEVRTVVRNSIVRANLDLGAFEVDSGRRKKKATSERSVRGQMAAATVAQAAKAAKAEDDATETAESSNDSPLTAAPVKVIRIKSRRSYSATGGERMAASASGHSLMSGHGAENGTDDGHSALGHTAPLFDGPEEDDADEVPPPDALSKMIPFTLFVPEPVRVRERQARPTSPERQMSMNSIAENLPPVPPLPRGLAKIKKQSPPGSASTNGEPDQIARQAENSEEVLEKGTGEIDSSVEVAETGGARQSLESASVHPSQGGTAALAALSHVPFTPPSPSHRFRRDFRFGHANMLDTRHCDFSLMRTCILGSHVDVLRESTALRYERFRSQRLELRRLTRQGEQDGRLTKDRKANRVIATHMQPHYLRCDLHLHSS